LGTFSSSGLYLPAGQHIQEVTATLERKIAQHLTARMEYRHDMANQPAFLKGNSPVSEQSTVTAGLVLALEPNK